MSDECRAPRSVTVVHNYALAADQFSMETFTLNATLKVTLAHIPAAGFFLLFLNHTPQVLDDDYTVDFLTGIVTIIGGSVGQQVDLVYVRA